MEDHDSITVIAAAISLLTKERRDTPVRISSVAPVSVKKALHSKGKGGHRSKNKRFYGGRNRKGNFQKRRKRD